MRYLQTDQSTKTSTEYWFNPLRQTAGHQILSCGSKIALDMMLPVAAVFDIELSTNMLHVDQLTT